MEKLFDSIPRIEGEHILLDRLTYSDMPGLEELAGDETVYRYLPTFLYERQTDDLKKVVDGLYGELFRNKESLILGVFEKPERRSCGLAEFYGFKDSIRKTCIGYKLLRKCWGKGIATETVGLMIDWLFSRTDTEIVTASTMPANTASARVLEKNGFIRTARDVPEDWGFPEPTPADKWFR